MLAGSRDTANESRYDGSWRRDDKVYTLSSQCVTLGSSLYYAATWLKLSLLDPSVSYSDDTILFSGSK
ncbi:MAG: hypothetical protein E3V96_00225 [Wolbachia pipientis]|nr:hypothetical protein [Wolbachia pipientis]